MTKADFKLLKQETIGMTGNWSDALRQICESTQRLISAQAQTKTRVGESGILGAKTGIVNAFDGLQHFGVPVR